ncbi:MAG: DUF1573 domain-containing protein [Ferruginibacter sp.]
MLRIFILTSFLVIFLTGCKEENKEKKANVINEKSSETALTSVQIIDSSYDFGQVTEGEIVEFNFRFKNTGSVPLVVTNVAASCGCTVPEKPEQPIRPGETGYIKAKFDSDKRPGEALKTVTVTSNASPSFPELILKGKVLPKKAI